MISKELKAIYQAELDSCLISNVVEKEQHIVRGKYFSFKTVCSEKYFALMLDMQEARKYRQLFEIGSKIYKESNSLEAVLINNERTDKVVFSSYYKTPIWKMPFTIITTFFYIVLLIAFLVIPDLSFFR